MSIFSREKLYGTLARVSGLLLVVVCVLFQRRGLMDWSEAVFLAACILLQETFLRLPALRKLRTVMLVVYSLLPLALVLYHGAEIQSYAGDFVKVVLHTPLPLVLVSVQVMVLYVREASRLVSVVLVLALFSTVIGVRRPLDDSVWPWLAAIAATGAVFLMLQYPGMLYHGVYMARRRGLLPPAGRPGGIMRASFIGVLPLFTTFVLLVSLLLYFALPRFEPTADSQGGFTSSLPQEPGGGPAGGAGPRPGSGGAGNTRIEPEVPASVSGLASGVDLGDFGEIKRTDTPALDLTLMEPAGDAVQRVYLRTFTYASFDGARWSPLSANATTTFEVPDGVDRALPNAPRPRGNAWRRRRYHILLHEAGMGAGGQLPLVTEASAIHEYAGAVYYDAASNTLRAPAMGPGDSFHVTASQLVATTEQLSAMLAGRGPDAAPRPEYLHVPAGLKEQVQARFGLYQRFADMARASPPGRRPRNTGVYLAANDIVKMFREATLKGATTPAWTYSLDFRPEPGPDAIARFLDTNTNRAERFGHCEYFASAMCILLRCYGVPARLAAGFLAAQPNLDRRFEVTSASAHAWVEVYFEGLGWIAFDPTPPERSQDGGENPTGATAPPDTVQQPDAAHGTDDDGSGGPEPADWLRRYDGEAQQRMFAEVSSYMKDAAGGIDAGLGKLTAWMPDGLFPKNGMLRAAFLLLPVLTVGTLLILRRRRRKRIEGRVLRQMGEGGRKRERGLYLQLLLLLARHGFQKQASETPREFAQRVMRRGGRRHAPVVELTEIYYSLRFGLDAGLEGEFKRALGKYADALQSSSAEAQPAHEPA